ncbi:response regulator [Oceanibacterium hippocampi]|uniref:Response regulator of RpoS n=1 Tax=Oceanibacterium hippocampi TaxID=745714 RepID=A0A1Y5RIV5_9PROT|nr:response regulator [Oceanibacterium hippocampi]SLN18633.1 response regulator of RpoS [Oceanibacterium hippocampi]
MPRLLVMDDEPDFGDFVRRVAESLDFSVLVISDPRKFEETYLEFEPDMIVLDIVMPERDGIEIIDWLIKRRNQARVLIVTGYNPAYARSAELLGKSRGIFEVSTLSKPMHVADLKSALKSAEA